MVDRRLLRSCQAKVEELPLREPFNSAQLLDDLAASRARPIRVATLPWLASPDLPCGVWIAKSDADHVFVEQGTTGVHREHIVMHEIGHIVCDHGTNGSTVLLEQLMPNLAPEVVKKVLGRSCYTQPQEREAELVATLALARMGQLVSAARHSASSGTPPDVVLGRLDQVLGGDRWRT